MQQLQYSLQTLALPVTAQLRLHKQEGCRVEELAYTFDCWQRTVRQELVGLLTSEQINVLHQLDQKLLRLSHSCKKPAWSDVSLRQSADWRHVRRLAREALAHFDWPLDVPPQAHKEGVFDCLRP